MQESEKPNEQFLDGGCSQRLIEKVDKRRGYSLWLNGYTETPFSDVVEEDEFFDRTGRYRKTPFLDWIVLLPGKTALFTQELSI